MGNDVKINNNCVALSARKPERGAIIQHFEIAARSNDTQLGMARVEDCVSFADNRIPENTVVTDLVLFLWDFGCECESGSREEFTAASLSGGLLVARFPPVCHLASGELCHGPIYCFVRLFVIFCP